MLKLKTDYGTIPFNYNPAAYKTKAGAARGLYKALCEVAKMWGMNPNREVHISSPEQEKARGNHPCWRVSWEAGPYEWAIPMSFQRTGPWGFTEPHYSFDLCFTD
mgnify:CR=1 FL=1